MGNVFNEEGDTARENNLLSVPLLLRRLKVDNSKSTLLVWGFIIQNISNSLKCIHLNPYYHKLAFARGFVRMDKTKEVPFVFQTILYYAYTEIGSAF